MTATDHLNLLLVEDNPADAYLLTEMLQDTGIGIYQLHKETRLEDAQKFLRNNTVHLILLDLSLPDSAGLDSFLDIQRINNKIPVIILTGLSDTELATYAIQAGAQDYLVKGEFDESLLSRTIQYSLERKKQEEKVRESEEKYRQMFYQNPFPAWIYDPVTLKFLEVNNTAVELYGYSREEFLSMTLKDIRPAEDIVAFLKLTGTDVAKDQLWRHKKKDGSIMIVEVSFYPISYFGKTAMQAQIHDITEKMRMEKEIADHARLRQQQITKAVLTAQEQERKYLGEELHDNINQVLATVKLYLELAMSGPPNQNELIAKSSANIIRTIDEIRKLSRKLVSPGLQTGSLSELLSDLINEIAFASEIIFDVDFRNMNEDYIQEEQKIAIYRIIQEQLNNIIKYAGAKNVTININSEEESLIVIIIDDGKGFDLSAARAGVGITNIISRAEAFNGKVEIDTAPGKGCVLKVYMETIKDADDKNAVRL